MTGTGRRRRSRSTIRSAISRSARRPGWPRRYRRCDGLPSGIDLDAGGHRVGNVLPADHALYVSGARQADLADDDRHERVTPPHTTDDVEDDVVLPSDDESAVCDIAQGYCQLAALEAVPQAGIDPLHADDAVA